jgi:hypothetical protein
MSTACKSTVAAALAFLLIAPCTLAAAETAAVAVKKISLRASADFSSAALVEIVLGDRLAVVARKGGWVQVQAKGLTGWVHGSALVVKTAPTEDDVAFRSRSAPGFTSRVEGEPPVRRDYAAVDAMERLRPSESALVEFRRAGNLLAREAGTAGDREETAATPASLEPRGSSSGVSAREEYAIGRSVAARILGTYRTLDRPVETAYLNALGTTLARFSAVPAPYGGWSFLLLDSDELNAFAAPGGFVFVTHGLYRTCRDEEQLAAVVAHEIGHVVLRHGLASIKQKRLTEVFGTTPSETEWELGASDREKPASALAGFVDCIFERMAVSGYSRKEEDAADREAALIAYRAGYDPAGLPGFLRILQQGPGAAGNKGFFSTHPLPAMRLAAVERHLANNHLVGETDAARTARFTKKR